MILLSLFSQISLAEPMDGNVHLAAGQSAFDVLTEFAMEIPIEFQQDEISQPYECYDSMGIENLNLSAEWNDLSVTLFESYFEVDGSFDEVRGEDIVIFGDDEDWFDLCVSFEVDIHYVDIQDLEFSMRLSPSINSEGKLEMMIIGAPIVQGELDTDIGWFPDDLALLFFEDTIWNLIEDQLAEQIPALVNEYADLLYFQGETETLAYEIGLADTSVREDAFLLSGELDLEYLGGGECISGVEGYEGREIELPFAGISSADVAFGLTEYDLNSVLKGLWDDGLFCLSEDELTGLLTSLEDVFDPSVGGLSAEVILGGVPKIVMGDSGLSIDLQEANLKLMSQDSENMLLDLTANISAELSLTVDPSISSIGLSLHGLELDITNITAEDILVDNEYSEQYLEQFVENWAVGLIEERLTELSLYRSVFHEFGFYVFAKGITYHEGGMEVYMDLYNENDPEVDQTPPETTVSLDEQDGSTVLLSWTGEDDRWDDLVFSYRLDDGSWSSWSLDTSVTLEEVLPGDHSFEVKARDKWWNEDPIPASVEFSVEASTSTDESVEENALPEPKGCGSCSQHGNQQDVFQSSLVWLAGLGLILGFRRRE